MASDLIRREDVLNETWFCDLDHWSGKVIDDDVINEIPAVDAVEVVRCEDCVCVSVWNDELVCERISNVMNGYYHGTVDVVKPDDYCSHGVRKKAVRCE